MFDDYHKHTGLDSPKINPKDLKGFPVFTSAPTHNAQQGTIILRDNGTDTRELYVMLGGTWYKTTLT